MTQGLPATRIAGGRDWDQALSGHSRIEREQAEVYVLDV